MAELLATLLTADGHKIEWKSGDDPPDLVFSVNEERWAVEVTRMDQLVRASDGIRTRSDADLKLANFGKSVAAELRDTLKRPYTLTLRPLGGVTDTKPWRAKSRKTIREIVSADEPGPFVIDANGRTAQRELRIGDREVRAELRGYSPTEAANCIFVLIDAGRATTPAGHAPHDISANVEEAMAFALTAKAKKLSMCRGYDRFVLVLDNKYWLADLSDARTIAQSIAPRFTIFNRVYMTHDRSMSEIFRR